MYTVKIPISPGLINHKLPSTILCFSHLRWDFVFQRPQHIITRLAKRFSVYYVEEPIIHEGAHSYLETRLDKGVTIAVPHISSHSVDITEDLRILLDNYIVSAKIGSFTAWYYTPMALSFTRHLRPHMVVYDCMDELSAFKFAPPSLLHMEVELLLLADVVFTGGKSLYEAKKSRHSNVHFFPSSIDEAHFGQAKLMTNIPSDQEMIPSPILGFFGVIDERFDIELIANVARLRPEWQIVLIGPVVKIEAEQLPRGNNINYLGSKKYEELPSYLAGWDIALIPFALNESTRFISPTKTPEYLAAGIPVISTPIKDVVDPYGVEGLVTIISNADEFITAAEDIMEHGMDEMWQTKVTAHLALSSWDRTVDEMVNQLLGLKAAISN